MGSSELDHNHYPIDHQQRRPSQVEIGNDAEHHPVLSTPRTPQSLEDTTLYLPATTYTNPGRSPRSKLSISTNLGSRPVNSHYDQVDCSAADDEVSPDPHVYYRQLHDPFAAGTVGQANLDVEATNVWSNDLSKRKSSLSSVWANAPSSLSNSRADIRQPYQASPSSQYREGAPVSAKSNPSFTSLVRPRQASFQDLVAKFDKSGPPQSLYARGGNDSGPRNASPAASFGASDGAPHTVSQTRSRGPQTKSAARKPSQESTNSSRSKSSQTAHQWSTNRRASFALPSNRTASQSMTDLAPSTTRPPRRPLFGEVVFSTSASDTFSFGLHQPVQRRGSVGSPMHSPSPMFPRSAGGFEPDVSATSPDAWYRDFNPAYGADIDDSQDDGRRPQHRRAQSDVNAAPCMSQAVPFMSHSVPKLASPVEITNANSGVSVKRNSQSRIPVRRRHSHASDSTTSAPSSRAPSTLSRHATNQENLPSVSKVSQKSNKKAPSPRSTAKPSIPPSSPSKAAARRDRNRASHQGHKSPLLRANIIAPPPKISPPLRSSRPRVPVSAASTTSSRAKTIERLSTLQKQGQDPPTSTSRSKRPPELENVDLEARRQKITQAFNKTIRENAQKEKFAAERRRKARERAQAEEAAQRNDSTSTISPTNASREPPVKKGHVPGEDEGEGDASETPGEEPSASEHSLGEAGSQVPEHQLAAPVMRDEGRVDGNDSPTLGRPSVFQSGFMSRSHSPGEASDLPPLSAVTAETDGTLFDNEPQIEPAESSSVHRTLLSQIMNMRSSSRVTSPALSETGSEQAEKESIQIMLRNTTYYDHNESPQQALGTGDEIQRTFLNEERLEQWSNSSWTSSIRDRSSLEGPLEPIVEKSPDRRNQPTDGRSPSPSRSTNETFTETQFAAEADAYNSVSRVLEQEYSTRPVNRNHFGDIYQKILEQSPDLARQGGWDTQRVTQLCLQEIDRGKYERLLKASSQLKEHQETTREVSTSPSPGLGSLMPEKHLQVHKYRASLDNAEDFAFTSPSIVDWMPFAAQDSPTDEGVDVAPPIPPKDSEPTLARDGALTPRAEHPDEVSGGGLNIHLRSPTKSPLSQTPPPRPPSHSPPPLPHVIRSIDETSVAFVQSPSIYGNGPPSSIFPHKSSSPQPPQVPQRITSLSQMASRQNSTDAIPASSKQPVSVPSSSFSNGRLSLSQPVLDSTGHRASPSPEQKKVNSRKHVIKELVDTEATFGRDMSVVDDIYKGTSGSCLDLSAEDVKILFGNSAQIVKFSLDFLDSLKLAAKSVYTMPKSQRFQSKRSSLAPSASTLATTASDDQADAETDPTTDLEKDRDTYIGEAFKKNMREMEKVYTIYLKNQDAANRKLQALQQNPKVEIWLKECREWAADLTTAWNLDSLLVKPVQRLLKYPLLLTQLLEYTPEDHPDRAAIRDAMRDLTEISVRINEMKKHSELVEQGLKRNRKESDVRIGLSKAIGRQTEKLKQNVGVSRVVEDKEYAQLRERYSENLAHLVLVREDVRTYMGAVSKSTHRFNELALAIDGWIDVGHTGYPEKESRWRQFGMIVRELVTVAIPDHVGAVQKVVVDPMTAAAKMLEALLKDSKGLVQRRDKKSIDYARWKNVKDRGEKLDKKTIDRMEEWEALNREAKGRMTRLIDLTSDLAQGCLQSFVQIQCTWLRIWQHKLAVVIGGTTPEISRITREWQEDFDYHQAQALTLGICNGSLLAEAVNILSYATPISSFDGASSPRQHSWNGPGKRSFSINSDGSPNLSNEFTPRHSGSFTASPKTETHDRGQHLFPADRLRAISATSGPGTTSHVAISNNGSMTALGTTAGQGAPIARPSTSAGSSGPRSPMPPRLSLDAPSPTIGTIQPRSTTARPDSGSTFYSANGGLVSSSATFSPSPNPHTNTGSSTSDIFSSALPLSESPLAAMSSTNSASEEGRRIDVLFLAASVYEFNIDRSRREAGFPYLTYVAGEIFDVIAERGELWLARNQDDPHKQIGWIWNKHFAKLAET